MKLTRLADKKRGNKYDISARDLKDHISVLDIDHPGPDGLYGLRTLKIVGDYRSSTGGKEIDVHGIDIESISPTRLRFWMINHRPAIDSNGNQLDPKKVGANSTIEVFEHEKGSENLQWVRTIFSDTVSTPNNLIAMGDGEALVTNDHNSKTGAVSTPLTYSNKILTYPQLRQIEMIFGGGSVAYCPPSSSPNTTCTIALSTGLSFANGITRLPHPNHNTILVAHSSAGHLTSHTFYPSNHTLSPGSQIKLNMPMDNLVVDSKGDVYVAAFPKILSLVQALDGKVPEKGKWIEIPSTVFRVRRVDGGEGQWEIKKVLEDVEGTALPGSTVAVHDVKTGMLWMGGVASPFISVCEVLG